jgi:amino acid adenylation domain-containing protein
MIEMPNLIPIDFNPFEEGKEIEKITFTNDSQREIWLSCILGGDAANLAYNESSSLELSGTLYFEALKKSVQKLVLRHEALRSTISANGETLIIYKDAPVELNIQDISDLGSEEQGKSLSSFLKQEMNTPLNLQEGPLFKAFLHKLGENKHYFTLIKHHAIGDGWSTGIILEDLSKLYNAYSKGYDINLPRPAQISDYAKAQERFKLTPAYQQTEDYWLNLYKDNVPVVDLPTDRPRQSPRTYNGNRIDYPLPNDLVSQLKLVGAKAGCSLVTTLLSAFEVFIYQKTSQKDVIVGLPASGQSASELYDLVGHCVNLLPLKSVINPKQQFNAYLKKRKGEILDAYDHQRLTFGELIKKLYIPRDSSRVTLVPIIFNIDMGMDQSVAFDGLKHKLISNPREYENFEIYLNATGSSEGIVLEWSYNRDLFDIKTIEQFHQDYETLLKKIVANPEIVIAGLREKNGSDILKIAEQRVSIPVNNTLNELIYAAAKKYPNQIAVSFNNTFITYQELNAKANQLAHLLISKNVKAGDKIALSIDRSLEMIVALLAVIKTGSAYVPLDMSYPAERINFIIENSDAKFLLVSKKNAEKYAQVADSVLFIEDTIQEAARFPTEDLTVKTEKNSLVYILHTSGSTGNPKGVCMGQNALVNLLLWQEKHSTADSQTRTLQFSPLSFDVSFQEIFATLTKGGMLILITEELRFDPFKLLELIHQQNVNRIFLPFVALQAITESAVASSIYPEGLKEVMTAGEQLKITPQIVKFFSEIPGAFLYNQYGPTEAHVVTELKLSGDPEKWPNLPNIGKEIFNTRIFILDEQLCELDEGEIGELCISGLCLAEGYLNLPEMTQEKFTKLPGSEIRIYRTGDLARFLPDGNIEFLGRSDHQVKIRGYRIELGEIEAHLNKQEGIKQAVVNAQEDASGNKRLIAYLTSDTIELGKEGAVSWHERWDSIYDSGVKSGKSKDDETSDEILDLLIGNQLSNSDDYKVQANEWNVESTRRIKEIGAKKIIEIGCGGGQFITDLAPDAEKYFATDYSEVAINYINEKIKAQPEKWKNVTAVVAEANDFSKIAGQSPDLILINSVIQYFPNAKYLFSVIEQAANAVKEGCIFIGDVQSHSALKMHHASEQLLHSSDQLSISDFEERVTRRMNIEDELSIDPEFFYFIKTEIPQITHIEVQLRKGSYVNETTKYHYDVWLYVNSPVIVSEPEEIVDWQVFTSFSELEEKLVQLPLKTIIVSNIPNQRVWNDYNLIRVLEELPSSGTVADIKAALGKSINDLTFDPNVFWDLGNRLNFDTFVRWTNNGSEGSFEVVFIPKDSSIKKGCVSPAALASSKSRIGDFEDTLNIIINSNNNELITLWKNNLKKVLPEYMVPNEFVMLNKLPLTATGKIDRKALPAVSEPASSKNAHSFIAPRTSAERLVGGIWSDVLNIKEISIDSNFFELGGHSLIAVKVMVAIEKETGKRLPLATLFENSTIEGLAKMLAADENEIKWNSLVPIKKTGSKIPIYMIHGGGLNVIVFNPLGKYMNKEQPVYGMQALGLNGKTELLYSMEALADRYNQEIINNDPVGPYALAGYSFGGLLAYEMAKRLIAMGKEIKMLGILDTYAGGKDIKQSISKKIYAKIIRQFKKVNFFSRLLMTNPMETIEYQLLVLKRKINRLFFGAKVGSYDKIFLYDDEIYKSYDMAWKNYRMQPFDIHVDVFRTKKRIYFLDDMAYLGWREYAKKGVSVHEVPGDHKTFLFPPNDKEFAEILQEVLDSKP